MSRHSSSRHKPSSRHKGMDADSEVILESVKRVLNQIDSAISDDPDGWEIHIGRARAACSSLDRIHFFRHASRLPEQQWIIQVLQDFAYHDADDGSIRDIAEWCQTSWLRVLRDHPDNAEILTGLGRNWLQRSQETLSRIHQDEGSSSSGGSAESADAAAQRINGPLYVEARGYLQPAVDFYNRAVRAADSSNQLTGDLLASAAEAYMSLGNVCTTLVAEQHFSRAIQFLRRTEEVAGYTLSIYLQQYLEEYGRLYQQLLQHEPFQLSARYPTPKAYENLKDAVKMLEARLEQANLLKKVVDAIKDLVQDCNFDCNDSGIALQAMDNSHVALVSMMLKAEGFSPYRCDRNIALGVNLTSLTKVLRAAQNEDILTLKAEDTPDVLNLVFESSESDRISEYDLKLMDIDQEHLGIPETEYAATISMPSSEFRRICTDLMALSESVSIEASKDGVKFACDGDIGKGAVTLRSHTNVEKPELNVDIELSEPVSLMFSLKYLVNFCKAAGLSSTVKLCLSNEVPFLVEYNLSGSSYLRFYLAPKIGEED